MREPLANGSVERVLSDLSDLSAYAAFSFDAVYAFIIAINQLLHAGVAADAIRGQVLLEEMRRTSFTGVSGEARSIEPRGRQQKGQSLVLSALAQVSFDENGDRLSAYQLWNMKTGTTPQGQPAVEAVVAASFSASTLNFTFIDGLVWMDGSQASQPPPELYSCDPGFYKDLSSKCMECPRGQSCFGGPQAPSLPCPRGTFANSTGNTACLPCLRGTAARDVGSVECTPCQPGFEAPLEGMETCTRCELGFYRTRSRSTVVQLRRMNVSVPKVPSCARMVAAHAAAHPALRDSTAQLARKSLSNGVASGRSFLALGSVTSWCSAAEIRKSAHRGHLASARPAGRDWPATTARKSISQQKAGVSLAAR